MNWRRTMLLTGAALAIVVVGASIVSSRDDDSADGPPEGAENSPGSTPTQTTETPTEPPTQTQPTQTQTSEDPPAEEPITFVGRVEGSAATLAVVADGGEATAYFCDGASLEAWLDGSATDSRLRMSADNGALNGSFNGRRATGSVRVGGSRFGFSLRQVSPPRGLYRFADTIDGADVVGGWIVLPNGRQIGVVTVDGRSGPAPRLDPATGRVTIEGQTVTAQPQGASL